MGERRTPPGSEAGTRKASRSGEPSRAILPATAAQAKLRIYLASPLSTFGTERAARLVTAVETRYPSSTLLLPERLFSSTADWRARWPRMLRSIDRFVFFAEPDGVIGLGVYQELDDALSRELPVEFVTDDSRLVPAAAIYVTPFNDATPERFAWVVERRLITPRIEDEIARSPSVTLAQMLALVGGPG